MRNIAILMTALLFSVMIMVLAKSAVISGRAVDVIEASDTGYVSQQEVQKAAASFVNSRAAEFLGPMADICLVIQVDERTYSYEFVKKGLELKMQETYCANPGQDDVIIKFNSYQDFLEAKSKPRWFIENRINSGYYLFPSNFIQQGGEIKCSGSFQENYCGTLYLYFSGSKIRDLGAGCCASYRPKNIAGLAFARFAYNRNLLLYVIIFLAIVAILFFASRRRKKH